MLAAAGLETDSALRDYDTLAAVLAGTTNEATNSSRKTLTDAQLSAYTLDDTNDLIRLPMSDQTWAAVAAGDSWSKLLICYDSDTTGGTDANIVPVCAHDLRANGAALVPNGSDIIVSFPNGYTVCS